MGGQGFCYEVKDCNGEEVVHMTKSIGKGCLIFKVIFEKVHDSVNW